MKNSYRKPICRIIEIESMSMIASSFPELNNNDADKNSPVLSKREKREWGNLW
ncbi:MAG: hypothetical protein IKL29_04665 [Bacteroidaceae bacterium]|nr:hypothetical protein [Bacteroidaceae bacterium]